MLTEKEVEWYRRKLYEVMYKTTPETTKTAHDNVTALVTEIYHSGKQYGHDVGFQSGMIKGYEKGNSDGRFAGYNECKDEFEWKISEGELIPKSEYTPELKDIEITEKE